MLIEWGRVKGVVVIPQLAGEATLKNRHFFLFDELTEEFIYNSGSRWTCRLKIQGAGPRQGGEIACSLPELIQFLESENKFRFRIQKAEAKNKIQIQFLLPPLAQQDRAPNLVTPTLLGDFFQNAFFLE